MFFTRRIYFQHPLILNILLLYLATFHISLLILNLTLYLQLVLSTDLQLLGPRAYPFAREIHSRDPRFFYSIRYN